MSKIQKKCFSALFTLPNQLRPWLFNTSYNCRLVREAFKLQPGILSINISKEMLCSFNLNIAKQNNVLLSDVIETRRIKIMKWIFKKPAQKRNVRKKLTQCCFKKRSINLTNYYWLLYTSRHECLYRNMRSTWR